MGGSSLCACAGSWGDLFHYGGRHLAWGKGRALVLQGEQLALCYSVHGAGPPSLVLCKTQETSWCTGWMSGSGRLPIFPDKLLAWAQSSELAGAHGTWPLALDPVGWGLCSGGLQAPCLAAVLTVPVPRLPRAFAWAYPHCCVQTGIQQPLC